MEESTPKKSIPAGLIAGIAAAALGVLIVNKRRRRGREALFVNRKAAMEAAEPIQEQEDTAK